MRATARRYPATFAGCATALLLGAFFALSGALWPSELPAYATSRGQVIGIALMLVLLPAYVVATGIVAQRRSLRFVGQLRGTAVGAEAADAAAAAIRGALRKSWMWGAIAGFAMAPFNTQLLEAIRNSTVPVLEISISLGQYVLWVSVGLAVGVRVVAARAFSRLGDRVDINLFDLDALKPLARSRLLDVVVIAGGLALTALQSLDAEFRWENYRFAGLVMIPCATFMLLWPLRSVHRRLVAEKQRQLEKVDGMLHSARGARTSDEVLRLETLLAHRDRLRQLSTWPLDMALLSRFAFYVVIPPLAWVGAALVENVVDRFTAG